MLIGFFTINPVRIVNTINVDSVFNWEVLRWNMNSLAEIYSTQKNTKVDWCIM